MAGIRGATGSTGVMDTLGEQHRQIYFVRRSLITIVEMRKCLAAITGTDEYQARRLLLPEKHRASITEADRFLRRNEQLFQQLRNEFGGHIHEKWKTRQFQQWSAARSAR